MKVLYNFLRFNKGGGETLDTALKLNKRSYIDTIHSNSKGWITRSAINEKGYSQWHYKYAELNYRKYK